MAAHDTHHYVPVFLLKHWQSGADSKLSCFHRTHGRLLHERYSAKNVAKLRGLYALPARGLPQENVIETGYMTPRVDEPGSAAHRLLLSDGVAGLNDQQKQDWARILVSLIIRGPAMVERIQEEGRQVLSKSLAESTDEYLSIRGDDPADSLLSWVEANASSVLSHFGTAALPTIVESERLNGGLLHATWGIRTLRQASVDLLISDRPVFYCGGMAKNFLVALPIAPRLLFVAFNHEATGQALNRDSDTEVAKKTNRDTVAGALQYVYATDDRQQAFVEKHLGRAPT